MVSCFVFIAYFGLFWVKDTIFVPYIIVDHNSKIISSQSF